MLGALAWVEWKDIVANFAAVQRGRLYVKKWVLEEGLTFSGLWVRGDKKFGDHWGNGFAGQRLR